MHDPVSPVASRSATGQLKNWQLPQCYWAFRQRVGDADQLKHYRTVREGGLQTCALVRIGSGTRWDVRLHDLRRDRHDNGLPMAGVVHARMLEGPRARHKTTAMADALHPISVRDPHMSVDASRAGRRGHLAEMMSGMLRHEHTWFYRSGG